MQNAELSKKSIRSVSLGSSAIVGVIIFLIIYATNIQPARANQATLVAIRATQSGVNIFELYDHAQSIPTPHIDDVRNDFGRQAQQLIAQLYQQGKTQEADKLVDLVRSELKKNLELHPLDIRVHIQLAQIDQSIAQIKQDTALLVESRQLLQETLEFSPKRQQAQYMLAGVYLQFNQNDEAIDLLRASIDNNPQISEGWWRLALVYKSKGDIETARQVLDEAQNSGVVFSVQEQEIVNSILTNA